MPAPPAVTLGIDLGTGSTKAALVDRNGRTVVERSAPHPATAEVDTERWWRSVVAAVGAAVGTAAGGSGARVAAVGLSGQMHGVVLLDGALAPLAPAITWADARSPATVAAVAAMAAPHAATIANPVVAGMPAVTLRWLHTNRPDLLEAASVVVQPKDWLGARLTGVAVSDPTDASATLLWDFGTDGWHGAFATELGLDAALLPPVHPSDQVRGALAGAPAEQLGLPAGLPVTVGRGDTAAALVGSGAAAGDLPQLSVGTGGQICHLLRRPLADPSRRTHLFRGPGPAQWYAMAATLSAGLALEWVRSLFGVSWPQLYDEAFGAAAGPGAVFGAAAGPGAVFGAAAGPGAVFGAAAGPGAVFLPYVAGERTPHLDPGRSAAWAGLRLHHTRADLLRAALEGSAFALRDAYDALAAVPSGGPLVLAGGGTMDPRWRQLLADVLQRPLAVAPHGGGSARGAALSAAVAAGWFDDLRAAVATAGPPAVVAEPAGPARTERLDRFRMVASALADAAVSGPDSPAAGGPAR